MRVRGATKVGSRESHRAKTADLTSQGHPLPMSTAQRMARRHQLGPSVEFGKCPASTVTLPTTAGNCAATEITAQLPVWMKPRRERFISALCSGSLSVQPRPFPGLAIRTAQPLSRFRVVADDTFGRIIGQRSPEFHGKVRQDTTRR